MREYAFKAGLLNDCYSQNFKLITECMYYKVYLLFYNYVFDIYEIFHFLKAEATALFCIKYLRKCNLSAGGK